jgi:hypothetical protein
MALTTVSLPATPPTIAIASSGIFISTSSGSSSKITVAVPGAAAVTAYTTAWGVSAVTAAGGKANVYGSGHKAVTIAAQ